MPKTKGSQLRSKSKILNSYYIDYPSHRRGLNKNMTNIVCNHRKKGCLDESGEYTYTGPLFPFICYVCIELYVIRLVILIFESSGP